MAGDRISLLQEILDLREVVDAIRDWLTVKPKRYHYIVTVAYDRTTMTVQGTIESADGLSDPEKRYERVLDHVQVSHGVPNHNFSVLFYRTEAMR